MDDLEQQLIIDFKQETKRKLRPPGTKPAPRREPDWDNRLGPAVRPSFPGTADECRLQLIQLLHRALARLEGAEPQKAWEPRSQTWPWTSLGLTLMKAIALCDAIGDKAEKDAKTAPRK